MFALRCLGVSLSIFFLSYALLSLFVTQTWRVFFRFAQTSPPSRLADALASWRLFPLAAAAAITLGYALPSFLLLEPGSTHEPFGPMLIAFGCACLAGAVAGTFRTIAAQNRTSKAVSAWTEGAAPMEFAGSVPVMRVSSSAPMLTVAGVCAPRVLVSEKTVSVLSADELQTAIRHEFAHARRFDNLKKLLFRLAVFPGMSRLESVWSEAAEMAADDAAVGSAAEALDLASALIKLSRFAPIQQSPLTTGLMHSTTASLTARIERLFQWERKRAENSRRSYVKMFPIVAVLGCLVLTYAPVLTGMHEITEWLVR